MVVTPGAPRSQTEERRADRLGDVVEKHLPGDRLNRHCRMLPRSGPEKASRDQGLRIARVKFIAGDLFADESVVGLVRVECPNDVVAITPSIGPLEVIGIAT